MTDKKRRTVTTIETHEVWIIRKPEPELLESEILTPDETSGPTPVSQLCETSNGLETGESDKA